MTDQTRPQLDQRQVTKDKCRITHLGLDQREVQVIKSLFTVAPELAVHFEYGEPTDPTPFDVVFVNGDNPASVRIWQALSRAQLSVVPIFLATDIEEIANVKQVRKPLVFKKLVNVLQELITTDTAAAGAAPSGSGRILVVDDSFPARQYMRFKLEELAPPGKPYVVEFADSGENGVKAAERVAYDLVFVDLVMPGIDGYETCRQIKRLRDVPVAMLTGKAQTLDRMRANLAGCDSFLSKPPSDAELKAVLDKISSG